jgi:hypothetical protein
VAQKTQAESVSVNPNRSSQNRLTRTQAHHEMVLAIASNGLHNASSYIARNPTMLAARKIKKVPDKFPC